MSWTNDWDFPENGKKDARCFEGKIKTQMKEILTQYGDLCLIWCEPHGHKSLRRAASFTI